ncbi:nucleoside triphosphate pyrophosphatase [Gilvimarinus sp. DA14]|uniref:Maf family protein n=1 Tax=Gilvimarinus sp. DA14 TaxID=2956798 RepID=UPI0020B7F199|nr:nucleoside triphosphate pyrophosphatase [Gilvimarinus sp. DA14]UTF59674.1 Maf-like protein [Gilvimarinus sp. DA14]
MTPLYLASGSPRRRELLTQIGVKFQRVAVDVPEVQAPSETPSDYVQRLALDKARAGLRALDGKPGVVLGADTLGVLDGQVLEKPLSREHGADLLRAMSGREHTVMTAVATTDGERELLRLVQSQVRFRPLSEDDISRYWLTGEPQDKAGGYAIQGFGAVFVSELRGSYSAVVGLPLEATAQMLSEYNIPVWQS